MRYLQIITILFTIIACSNENKHLNKFIGEKLHLPNNAINILNKSNVQIDSVLLSHNKYKVICIINGDCNYCFSQLEKWNKIINTKELQNIPFLFYIHSVEGFEIFGWAYENDLKFDYPVILDNNDFFRKKNNISNMSPSVFLTSFDNIVLYTSSFTIDNNTLPNLIKHISK